jgi:hypothetical protein
LFLFCDSSVSHDSISDPAAVLLVAVTADDLRIDKRGDASGRQHLIISVINQPMEVFI